MFDAPPDTALRGPGISPAEAPADAGELAAALGLDDAAAHDFVRYRELLGEANAHMNLVGPSALAEFWPRHAWDGAQLLRFAPAARRFADLGSGAGLPGVVLAIALKGREGAQVILVESLVKRCRFLQAVVDELQLPAQVVHARAENAPAFPVDVVTARAVAPLHVLFGYARPYVRAGAVALFLKGRSAAAELAEARRTWRTDAELLPSLSDEEGRVVRVRSLARA